MAETKINYILFRGDRYYPNGGTKDEIVNCNSFAEAHDIARHWISTSPGSGFPWYEICSVNRFGYLTRMERRETVDANHPAEDVV